MYKVYISKTGQNYLYDSISNFFFELDDESRSKLPAMEGDTALLRCMGSNFWESTYGSYSFITQEFPIQTNEYESPDLLVIEVTQQCNFRCGYCIYSGHYKYERPHNNTAITKDKIDSIVDRYFSEEHSPEYVSFYGGEPLLQFDLIKYAIERIESRGFSPGYSMTTNASLLTNSQIVEYLISKDFHLNISFDGLNHDKYRRTITNQSTSQMVVDALKLIQGKNAVYFQNNITLSITLAPPYDLKENAAFFNSHPLFSQIKLLVNTINEADSDFFEDGKNEESRKKLSKDYIDLANEFIDMPGLGLPFHKALFADPFLRIDNRSISMQKDAFPPGPCVPGKNRLYITALGEKYMCERVGSYGCLGHLEDSNKKKDKYYAVLEDFRNYVTPYCKNCLYVRICDACFSIFHEGNHFADSNRIISICKDKQEWFDLMIYVYLSKKEKELS